jgi:hypothetical protein
VKGEEAVVGNAAGVRELARGVEEQNVEALVVLVRARDRGLRLRGGLSTATMRWQPAGARGSRGALGAGQQGGNSAGVEERMTHGGCSSRR